MTDINIIIHDYNQYTTHTDIKSLCCMQNEYNAICLFYISVKINFDTCKKSKTIMSYYNIFNMSSLTLAWYKSYFSFVSATLGGGENCVKVQVLTKKVLVT